MCLKLTAALLVCKRISQSFPSRCLQGTHFPFHDTLNSSLCQQPDFITSINNLSPLYSLLTLPWPYSLVPGPSECNVWAAILLCISNTNRLTLAILLLEWAVALRVWAISVKKCKPVAVVPRVRALCCSVSLGDVSEKCSLQLAKKWATGSNSFPENHLKTIFHKQCWTWKIKPMTHYLPLEKVITSLC